MLTTLNDSGVKNNVFSEIDEIRRNLSLLRDLENNLKRKLPDTFSKKRELSDFMDDTRKIYDKLGTVKVNLTKKMDSIKNTEVLAWHRLYPLTRESLSTLDSIENTRATLKFNSTIDISTSNTATTPKPSSNNNKQNSKLSNPSDSTVGNTGTTQSINVSKPAVNKVEEGKKVLETKKNDINNNLKKFAEGVSLEKTITNLNKVGYPADGEYSYNNGQYIITFESGKCKSIKYSNGVTANVVYNGNDFTISCVHSNPPRAIGIFGNDHNPNIKQYGGNQMDMKNNAAELLKTPYVINRLKKVFPGKTMEEYELYLCKITSTGCGYTALANVIFKQFRGREAEFEKKFGFSMYTINEKGEIDYNFEYLIFDLFTDVWDDRSKATYAKWSFDEIINGITIYAQDGSLTGEAQTASTGTSSRVVKEMLENIDNKYGLKMNKFEYTDYCYDSSGKYSTKTKKEVIEKLKLEFKTNDSVVIGTSGADLYTMDGKHDCHIGGHAMIMTGITESGDIIVSSWGKEYIIKFDTAERIGYYSYTF